MTSALHMASGGDTTALPRPTPAHLRLTTAAPGEPGDTCVGIARCARIAKPHGQWDIFLLFLGATPEEDRELRLTSHPARQGSPAISSRNAVWLDNRSG